MSVFADEHLFAFGRCWSCGQPFTFHPDLVPSIPVDPLTNLPLDVDEHGDICEVNPEAAKRAIKQPICATCIDRSNEQRRADGHELIHVLPGAYPGVT